MAAFSDDVYDYAARVGGPGDGPVAVTHVSVRWLANCHRSVATGLVANIAEHTVAASITCLKATIRGRVPRGLPLRTFRHEELIVAADGVLLTTKLVVVGDVMWMVMHVGKMVVLKKKAMTLGQFQCAPLALAWRTGTPPQPFNLNAYKMGE